MAIVASASPKTAVSLPSFGPQEPEKRLDAAFQSIMDSISATSPGGYSIKAGSAAVTGSETGIVTGLSVIQFAFAIIKSAATNDDFHAVTLDHGADGLLDLYVWKATATADTASIASAAPITVYWLAVGDA